MSDSAEQGVPRNWAKDVIKLVVGVALVAIVLWWIGPKWEEVRSLAEPRPGPLALALASTSVATVFTVARWKVLSENMGGTRLAYVAYFHAFTLTRVLGQFTSNLAMDTLGRGVALKSAGSERGLGHALAPIVLERVFDLVLPLMVGGWALAVASAQLQAHAELLLAATAVAFLMLAVPLLGPLARLALGAYAFVARRRANFEMPELSVSAKVAAQVGALSLARFSAVICQFWAIALGLGLSVGWVDMTAATPLAQITSLLGFTPGSLGFQEGGWAVSLGWIGLAPAAVALFILGQRLIITSCFGVLALLSWPLSRRAAHLRRRSGSATSETP